MATEKDFKIKNGLILNNDNSGGRLTRSGNYLKNTTQHGYIQFGPNNTGFGHIDTDRSQFYFSKKITVDEGIVQSYNENLVLRYYENSNHQLTISTSAATFAGNVVVTGNLTVNGSTVTNSATNTTIEDALIELGSGNSGANSNDLGLILERGTTGNNIFIGWDESEDKVAFGTTTATGSSTGNISYSRADILASSLDLANHIDIADSGKIRLGNSDDMQLYHNGTDSYVRDTATGSLILTGSRVIVKNAADNARMIDAVEGGAVKLLHNNVEKLETTSSGVKVSGSFPDFIIHDTDTTNDNFRILHNSGGTQLQVDPNNVSSGSYLLAAIDGTERLRITSAGNVGIGTENPLNGVDIVQSDSRTRVTAYGHIITRNHNHSVTNYWSIAPRNGGELDIAYGPADSNGTVTADLVTIKTDGKVGINESNPSYRLHIKETTSSSNYAFVENTTTGNAGIRLKNSQGDYVVFVGPDFRVYDWTNSVDRLRIDSSGRILKGISSSILGSSDVQLAGSGGPAKIAGYWSNNNPTADSSMLSIGGYSQSGSTFTGVGEIEFRCDQNNATSSGSHSGSIVTRVNAGNTSGTWSGHAYSFAGLKDRERLTRRSKRYYCLPEVASGTDTYNNFREEWDYQHIVGYNQYSWYRFTSH